MDNQIAAKILEYIDTIGKAASDTAKYGFELIVKQQVVSGIIDLTTMTIILLLTFLLAKHGFKATKGKRDEVKQKIENNRWYTTTESDDFYRALPWIPLVIFAITCFIGAFVIPESIAKMFNPEYYAIKEILDTLK